MYMYVCRCICMYVDVYVCMSVCLSVRPSVHPSVCLSVCVCVCLYVCMYVCSMHACMHACMYVYISRFQTHPNGNQAWTVFAVGLKPSKVLTPQCSVGPFRLPNSTHTVYLKERSIKRQNIKKWMIPWHSVTIHYRENSPLKQSLKPWPKSVQSKGSGGWGGSRG